MNKQKNIAVLIAAAFLFLALLDGWPYGFFTLLRFVVFASSAYVAWLASVSQKRKWIWVFGFIAVLFNPFIPIHLDRNMWKPIDLIVGTFMIVTVFALKLDNPKTDYPEKDKKSYLGLIIILAICFIVFVVLPKGPITVLLKGVIIVLTILGLAATNTLDYAVWIFNHHSNDL